VRTMCAAVLSFEAVVVGLSVPVMIRVNDVEPTPAAVAGLGLTLLAVVTAALLRFPWAYGLGWAVQVGAVALGFLTTAMFVVGGLFAGLWVVAVVLGRRIESAR